MDNDIKIEEKSTIHQEVMLFLGDELNNIHSSNVDKNYNIENEYAKTKKHKSPFVIILLCSCFVITVGIALMMHGIISARNEEIAVSLQEFDDMNLKNLLDNVSSAQTKYDAAVKNMAQIKGDMDTQIKNAQQTRDNELFVIESMKIKSKKAKDERINSINQMYEDTLSYIHAEYDGKLAAAENEVNEYKKRIDEFDAAKIQSAREQKKALDSERQLRELETKAITDRYESRISALESQMSDMQKKSTQEMLSAVNEVSKKYQAEIDTLDPKLNDAKANNIISAAKENSSESLNTTASLAQTQLSEEVQSKISEYQNMYDDYKYLDDVVASIPQENSIPSYVAASRDLVNSMSQFYVASEVSNYNEQVRLNNVIEQQKKDYTEALNNQQGLYESILDYTLAVSKASALLLTADGMENLQVYVTPKARYLISEEGADGEIRTAKVIKGKIMRGKNNTFHFVVAADKDGKLPEIDFSTIEAGTIVRIIAK